MNITVYSTKSCPRCTGLKKQLDEKKIPYSVCEDEELMLSKGISSIPVIEVDGKLLSSKESVQWVNAR